MSEPGPASQRHPHRRAAPERVAACVLTVSDTRTREIARSAAAIARDGVDAVILTGGTGVAPRDVTPEAVEPLLDRVVPGFGELFRMLSYQDIGSAAMLSRALAGLVRGRVVFALPGSRGAVELAMERLVLPEIGHLLGEARKIRP